MIPSTERLQLELNQSILSQNGKAWIKSLMTVQFKRLVCLNTLDGLDCKVNSDNIKSTR